MGGRPVSLFLSSGRSGTQWVARNLSDLYGRQIFVAHEPIGPNYRPPSTFRVADAAWPKEVDSHLNRVAEIVERQPYVETGWPLFSGIPRFLERFGNSVRVVHLTRHPVLAALSHMTHGCYSGSPRDYDYSKLGALGPESPGVFQTDYRERWESLTPFEKCLFWCTEVHLYARELEDSEPSLPMTRVRAEDILSGDGAAIGRLTDFLGIDRRPELAQRAATTVDEWPHQTPLNLDWRRAYSHPAALEVMRWLGYGFEDLDDDAIKERYRGPPPD